MNYTLGKAQLAALDKGGYRSRFGYFLSMGLGKTLLCLHEAQQLYDEGLIDSVLIVCPNSLVGNWASEVEKFGFSFNVIKQPNVDRPLTKGSFGVINYEKIITAAGDEIPKWLSKNRTYVVFDESVMLKNHTADRWRKVRVWHYLATYLRLLSGRPQVQSPLDLWPQLRLLGADVNSSPYAFRARFCKMGGFKMKQIVGAYNQDELHNILDTCSIFCSKEDYSEIPGKHYKSLDYELSPKQKAVYKQMKTDLVAEFDSNVISVMSAANAYGKLQQISSGFMFDTENDTIKWIEPFDKTPKFKALLDQVERIDGKLLISAHFRPTITALVDHFKCPVIRGGMTDEEITENKKAFNDGDAKIMIIQPASGKYGHTLLGTKEFRCSTMIYYENSFNLDDRLQSEDRINRIGQDTSCTYYDLFGTPVERAVVKRLRQKDVMSAEVLGLALREWN